MRTKKQFIIFFVIYELKDTEDLSLQHATQTLPVGSTAIDYINLYPANVENTVSS